jgi:hypothetical protein
MLQIARAQNQKQPNRHRLILLFSAKVSSVVVQKPTRRIVWKFRHLGGEGDLKIGREDFMEIMTDVKPDLLRLRPYDKRRCELQNPT